MNRRRFLSALSGGLLAAPLAAEAPQAVEVWKIGFLSDSSTARFPSIHPGMNFRRLAYVEGQNIAIESRYSK